MPFNGLGSFLPPPPPDYPAVAGTTVRAAQFNTVIQEIMNGLGRCVTRDGQSPIEGNLPMAGFRFTGAGPALARDQFVRVAEVQNGVYNFLTNVAGTANAITATAAMGMTDYQAGQVFYISILNDNTDAATLSINGLAALDIRRLGGATLQAGDLKSGGTYPLIYDGVRFQLLNVFTTSADLTNYALRDGTNSSGTWNINISGTAANATTAANALAVADGAISSAAKIAANIIPLSKLARSGTAGQFLRTAGAGGDPYWGDLPANGVASFNSRVGAVTLTYGDVTGALGFTPATSGHTHGYAGLDAIVSAAYIGAAGSNLQYIRFTRANGGVFDVISYHNPSGG